MEDDYTDDLLPRETYIVYGGDESAVGEYLAQIVIYGGETDATWTLTARVNGEVAWIEEGSHSATSYDPYSFNFDTFDSATVETDVYTVALDSIPGSEC